jgi:hypothetical protein
MAITLLRTHIPPLVVGSLLYMRQSQSNIPLQDILARVQNPDCWHGWETHEDGTTARSISFGLQMAKIFGQTSPEPDADDYALQVLRSAVRDHHHGDVDVTDPVLLTLFTQQVFKQTVAVLGSRHLTDVLQFTKDYRLSAAWMPVRTLLESAVTAAVVTVAMTCGRGEIGREKVDQNSEEDYTNTDWDSGDLPMRFEVDGAGSPASSHADASTSSEVSVIAESPDTHGTVEYPEDDAVLPPLAAPTGKK